MTGQIHEKLIIDGEKTSMAYCPPIPEEHPRIVPSYSDESILSSTACWRGYQGAWEVRDGKFYLVGIEGRIRLEGDEPLFADWFTGVLRVPRGEMLHYVHMGFGSVFEEEVHIKIERGLVTKSRIVDNRGKEHDESKLGWDNLPGGENRFEGDDDW